MDDGNGLVRTIEIKDRKGRVIGTKQVVTYAGLLKRAHEEGLKSIRTRLVQLPTETNAMTAISLAEVVTDKGAFRDYGDANPDNVNTTVVPHIIRMSVTRAKARALRDAVNVGVLSLEELGQEYQNGNAGGNGGSGSHTRTSADTDRPMTPNQRKYLFQLFEERGVNAEEAHARLCEVCGVDAVDRMTRRQASDIIQQLVNGVEVAQVAGGGGKTP